MSHYGASRLMWELTRDADLAAKFRSDPAAVLAGRDLDATERDALAGQDLRGLFELGIHPFVLYHFALRMAGGWSPQFMDDYLTQLTGLAVGNLET